MRHPLIGRVLLATGICGVTVLGGAASLSVAATEAPAAKTVPVAATEAPAAKTVPAAATAAAAPKDQHWAFLNQYCSKCHNADD